MGNYKWYRKLKGGVWHQHRFTNDAYQLRLNGHNDWWARYSKINRYSNVIDTEVYN